MMSLDNNKFATKDENHSITGRKTGSAKSQEPALKCPRCDSPNTKFCYYNNYNLSQPRHFCKTCRRYWTKGGALRSVPIGGGCRKNKKLKFNNSPRVSMDSKDYSIGSSSDIGGLKFFQGLAPAMDFQLGSINMSRIQSPNTGLLNQFPPFGQEMGFNFNPPIGFQELGSSLNVHSNLASSIESLSSINQDLHWKLQQQRLAMRFVGDNNEKDNNALPSIDIGLPFVQKPQPILFQNLDINSKENEYSLRKDGENGNLSTEWFFDNSSNNYGTVNPTQATSGSHLNENVNSWPSGVQAWNDFTQYNALP